MKKAVCISCTQHYNERTVYFLRYLREQGYACTYITSDFHHTKKEYFTTDVPDCVQIPTKSYKKNISLRRILSHMQFARDAMRMVKKLQPDLLYVEIPPNSLSREAAKYKRKTPGVKLVYDVFDMWPESFPNNRAKSLLKMPFAIWAWFRNCGLRKADVVLTECDLFRHKLQKYLRNTPNYTLHNCRSEATIDHPKQLPEQEEIHLCYLGSINNIIDIPGIFSLIGHIQKKRPVVLHIIGDGESRDAFVSAVESTGAHVIYHGRLYADSEKQAIFDQCSFGLNFMKDSVCVGLTMKSLDYFAGGLPILNSIECDTWNMVENYHMGINVNRENLEETALQIVNTPPQALQEMRISTLQHFNEMFVEPVFMEKLGGLI